jgi:hypothetical protein
MAFIHFHWLWEENNTAAKQIVGIACITIAFLLGK